MLTQGRGKYRCSKCNKVANALLALFDDWPNPGQQPSPIGEIPVLGQNIDLEKAGKTRLNPEEAGFTEGDEDAPAGKRSGNPWLRALWVTGALLLFVAIVFKWAEFEGHPIQEQPAVQDALIRMGLQEAPPKEVFRDLSLIHLFSRANCASAPPSSTGPRGCSPIRLSKSSCWTPQANPLQITVSSPKTISLPLRPAKPGCHPRPTCR